MFYILLISALINFYSAVRWNQLHSYKFHDYCAEFDKVYRDTDEIRFRRELFTQRLHQVRRHNSDLTKTWKLGINKFSDRTEEELSYLRGAIRANSEMKQFNEPKHLKTKVSIPNQIDWRQMGVISPVKDQGECGSCWSFASAETVESYYALKTGKMAILSEQQILDCTPNPNQCGGTGGCGGATAELAYAQIISMGGLSSEWTYSYNSYFGDNFECNMTRYRAVAKLGGYTNLPTNDAKPILKHLTTTGPLAVSVDASTWSFYEEGVFDGCNQTNPDLDHAVQLVGFGTDAKFGDYWLIRNSWSPSWGEQGYIRLKRTAQPRCGYDITPGDGDGCKNQTQPEYVCGTCGVVYDALFPIVTK